MPTSSPSPLRLWCWYVLSYVVHLQLLLLLLQSCPTLCDPIDGGPLGSVISGILQARTLEWVAISFSSAWKWKVKVKSLSHVRLFMTPWTTAHQVPLSMGFSRQEYWSGLPLPSPHLQSDYFKWKVVRFGSNPVLNMEPTTEPSRLQTRQILEKCSLE